MASSNPDILLDETTSRLTERVRAGRGPLRHPKKEAEFAEVRESSPWKVEESCRVAWGSAPLNPISVFTGRLEKWRLGEQQRVRIMGNKRTKWAGPKKTDPCFLLG